MKDRKSFKLVDLVSIIAIVSILAIILLPIVTHLRVAQANRCQSNLSRIGMSMMMYNNDWDGKYPTNRMRAPMNTFIAPQINLSDPNKLGSDGQPIVFESGVNWVEALYRYVGERASVGHYPCVWKCPSARIPTATNSPSVTYAFNANLVEARESAVRNKGKTMMCRELDRYYNAILKPPTATPNNTPSPQSPFLNDKEPVASPIKYRLHDEGSHLLMADGHVKYFPVSYYPWGCQWDSVDKQWYNYTTNVPNGDPRQKSIALIP